MQRGPPTATPPYNPVSTSPLKRDSPAAHTTSNTSMPTSPPSKTGVERSKTVIEFCVVLPIMPRESQKISRDVCYVLTNHRIDVMKKGKKKKEARV